MGFGVFGGGCSVYFSFSGIGVPRSSKARRWVGVGSASWLMMGVLLMSRNRMSFRVKVARWSRRLVKLRAGRSSVVVLVAALRSEPS